MVLAVLDGLVDVVEDVLGALARQLKVAVLLRVCCTHIIHFNTNNNNNKIQYFYSATFTECSIGLYSENAIAIESEARYTNGGNVYKVTMQI